MRIILPRLIIPRHVLANIGRECILLAYVVILTCMANMVNANVVIKNHSFDYQENNCEVSDLNGSHAGPYAETNIASLPEPLSMAMPSAAPAPASAAAGTDPFVLVYNVAAGNTITLPTNGTVNISVDWGDGSTNTYSTFGNRTHTYSTAGEYTVKITGTLTKFGNIGFTQEKLIRVTSFGDIGLIHLASAFRGAINLTQAPATLPATVTNLSSLFYGCTSFNQDISGWDVSNVSSMGSVFQGCKAFNQPLNTWNVSNVTIMGFMFANAENFNQPLNSWDVSKVKDMGYMFSGAKAFNQPLNGWNVSLVQSMGSMFTDCLNFNQDLSGWNMINVENFLGFLSGATLSTDNYDKLLVNLATGWRASITFSGGNSKYSQVGEVARTKLRTQKGWSITDGGPLPKLTVSSPTITATKAYDGTTSATVTPGTLSGMADGDVVTVSAEATYADANVGTGKTITVVYTLAGPASAKYNKPDNYTVTNGVITALPLSITDPTLPTTTKVYDGTPSATVTAGTLSGMLSGDDVIVSAAATYADANVGTGKTITVAYTLSGAASGNYTKPVDYTVTNGEITAKPLTVANPTLTTSKPYDGNTSVVVSAGTLSGVATGDGVTVSATGTYDTPSLGSGKTITVSYTLNGAKSNNYIKPADYQVTTGTISAKPLTITNPTLTTSKGYDGTPSATVTPGTLSGAVTGEGITVSAVATYANGNTGTGKTITVVYTLGGATSGNYTKPADYTVNTGVITVKPLTIAAPVLTTSKVYDGLTSATVTPGTLSGVVTGEDVTVLAAANYADAKAGTSKTITVVYTLGGSASGNYTKPANYTTTSGVITAKPLSITDPTLTTTKVYDGTPSTSVAVGTLSGKVGSDVVSATASANYDNANAGTGKTITVAFSIAGTASGNYTKPANYVVNNGEITAKPLSAPYTDLTTSKSYDGSTSAVVLPGGISGVITGDGVTVSATATYDTPSPGSGKTIAVSYTLNGAKSGNYIKPADYAVSSGAITAKPVTISGVTAANKVYDGGATAVLSGGTLNDVVGSEVVTITSGTGTFADKNAGSGIAVTAADYSLSGTDAGNYTLSAQPSGLTAGITKATLTATADDRTKVYGAVNPELTFKYSGWVNGEETIDIPPTIGTTVDATAAVGTYPGAITLSGGSDNNYEFAFLPADLEITKATLFVTPDMQIKTYGAVNPELTFKYDGWVNGEEPIDISPTISTSISTSTTVGTYPSAITLSGGADNNYDLILGPGGFIVRKAPLTVTADAQTKVYGAANPELTFKYSGWKNDENETVLDVQPTASTTVGATTAAGIHPGAITLSGGSDNNYEFAFLPADLEITKATLFVTPDMQIKTYGAVNPELTFKYDGWVNGEEPIDTPPTIGTTADATTAVGTYPGAITLSGGSDNNYEFAFVPANLEIAKATLTATADARTKVYGAANPELTFKYSGWVNGEETIDTPPTIGTAADAATAVGTYSEFITISGGSDNNYMFNYVPGALAVTKAPLTVTADTQTKVYGAANPELTFKYNGWVNGEDDSVLDTKPIASTTVNATSVVGNYAGAITLGDGSDNNYSFSYIAGNFDVVAPKIAGDTNGNSKIDGSEIAGDINGNGRIDGNEVPGDTSGNGMIDGTETAIDNTLPGALSADQDVISGAKPDLIISLAPGTGDGVITYTWESSVDNGLNWVVIPNETGLSYAPKTLTHTTWFRRVTTSTIKSLVFNAVTLPVRISVRPVETNDPDSPRGLIVYAIRNNEIKVKGKVSGDAVAALYDIRGNVIIVMNLEEGNLNTIPTPYIKTGIYLLKVKDRQRWQTFKVPVRE
jgi:surface protein